MAEVLGTLAGILLVVWCVYYWGKKISNGGKAIANAVRANNELANNIGNPAWERLHRAESMKYYWANNNSPINISVRLGHLTTRVYPYTPQMSTLAVPDSAGGWDIQVTVNNKSNKTIKYVKIPFTPYNPVGDIVYSSIGGESTVVTNFTGPIQPGQAMTFNVEKPWYNISLGWVETGIIEITFMDGTHYTWVSFPSVLS